MKVVIFGATGFVGKATLKQALDKNYQVTVLVRDKSKVAVQRSAVNCHKRCRGGKQHFISPENLHETYSSPFYEMVSIHYRR